ncbi:hypothetical protein FKM82_010290 [Ascaphus truei]
MQDIFGMQMCKTPIDEFIFFHMVLEREEVQTLPFLICIKIERRLGERISDEIGVTAVTELSRVSLFCKHRSDAQSFDWRCVCCVDVNYSMQKKINVYNRL